jgi:TatD DNase family protein
MPDDLRMVDTHCHLNLAQFDSDRQRVIGRASEVGVERIIVPGIDLESSRAAVDLADEEDSVYAAVGIHPHNAASWTKTAARELTALAGSGKVVAIGEIGLDYYRDLSPRDVQKIAFVEQLQLAGELKLPAIIHNRDAIDDVLNLSLIYSAGLQPEMSRRAGVLHAFSADLDSAKTAIAAGFYLGTAGPITFRNAEDRRTITASLPIEALVIETDSPYLSPHPLRGKRNEPANLKHIADGLALTLRKGMLSVAEITTQNAAALFDLYDGMDQN